MIRASNLRKKPGADFKPIAPEVWGQVIRNFEQAAKLIRKAGTRK